MNKTWINVNGTTVSGWAEGPEPPTDEWFAFDWRPEKSLTAYEYIVTAGGEQEVDDPDNEGQRRLLLRQRSSSSTSDWTDPEPEQVLWEVLFFICVLYPTHGLLVVGQG